MDFFAHINRHLFFINIWSILKYRMYKQLPVLIYNLKTSKIYRVQNVKKEEFEPDLITKESLNPNTFKI